MFYYCSTSIVVRCGSLWSVVVISHTALPALMGSKDHKTSFLVHDLLKLVGLVKESWAGVEAGGIIV